MSARDPNVLPGPGVHLIEASAGTGKTHALAQLYLAAVIGEGRLPSEILVVTFTEAAAGELQVRVHEMLREAKALLEGRPQPARETRALAALLERETARAGSAETARARLHSALARYDERRISTIHAFAAWVLAEYPMETGVVPGPMRLVDGTVRWREAIDDLWRERVTGADGAAFAAAYGKPEDLLKFVRPFRQFPLARTLPVSSDAELERALARLAAAYPPAAEEWGKGAQTAFRALLGVHGVLSRNQKEGYHASNVAIACESWQAYFAAGGGESPLDPWARLYSIDTMEANRTPGAIAENRPPPRHPVFDTLTELWSAHREVHAIRAVRRVTTLVAELERRARGLMAAAGERSFDDLIGLLYDVLCGAEGAALATALRRRLPLALIDEFQDTDARQYEIFRRVFVAEGEGDEPAPSLILIGDPKQSIYRFRGGDVFAYRSAQADVNSEPARLEHNYRSEPIAVAAINALFRGVSFQLDFVHYHPVQPVTPARRILRDPGLDAGLVLWDAGVAVKGQTKEVLADQAMACCADEIVRLLSGDVRVEVDGRAQPLRAEDIAVLVPWNSDVSRMARELERRGAGVALEARSAVYASDSARDLYALLAACAYPDDAGLARAALAVPGFDWTAGQLLSPDEGAYTEARALFRRWHEAWLAHGHDAVLAPLLARLAPLLARRADGARRITDLRHLVERLGRAPVSAQAPASLLAYLGERVAGDELAEEEADSLRPEPGEARVRVMTAHKSKGLEFGVVFLPLAWVAPMADKGGIATFHDEEGRVCLEFADDGTGAQLARREQIADALRVAYVTLTRARHRTYVVTGKLAKGGAGAGITQILFGDRANYEYLGVDAYAAAMTERVRAMEAGDAVLHRALPEPVGRKLDPGPPPLLPEAAALARALPAIEPTWSYSALKRLGEQSREHEVLPGTDDEIGAGEQSYRGARFGRCFHELMESIDFAAGADGLDPSQLRRALQRHGLDAGAGPLLARLCAATLAAELIPGLPLARLESGHAARELPFLLGLAGARVAELAGVLMRHPEYGHSGAALAAEPGRLSGWLRGYLDLVFESDGRYYVLDYKTDVLAGAEGYAPTALEAEVAARGYDLQYLLYSVALRRWLRQRHGAGGEERLGGVVYLFVRGLGAAPGHGVFRKAPDPALLAELETVLAGAAP